MNNRDVWLRQGFLLSDHPFEPMQDPVHGLDFRGLRISFSRWLDVFSTEKLADYFVQVGSIEQAVMGSHDGRSPRGIRDSYSASSRSRFSRRVRPRS
jgi:hypothetical protein